jgi:hypothetical protein
MKSMMHDSESVALNVARRRSNLVVIALVSLMAVGTLATLAEGQDTSKAPETTGDQADSRDKLMTQAELEQTGAQLAQELQAVVEQGTITSSQMDQFKIADVQRVIRDKRLSPREATDRLRFYQKLANGLKAGTLSGDEAARRIQTFNVMGDADASKNWVSGIWVSEAAGKDDPDKDLALFASTSGEIALGFLCTYTINEDETVKMVFTKPGDGVSPDVTLDMFFSRDAAGDVTMHEKREGRIEGEEPKEITLPLTPRQSALVSPDDERWIIGWWTLPVGDRPYALCFFPDGSCTFTDQYGIYKIDGKVADVKMRHSSRRMQEMTLEQGETASLSHLKIKSDEAQKEPSLAFTRKQPNPL